MRRWFRRKGKERPGTGAAPPEEETKRSRGHRETARRAGDRAVERARNAETTGRTWPAGFAAAAPGVRRRAAQRRGSPAAGPEISTPRRNRPLAETIPEALEAEQAHPHLSCRQRPRTLA